MLEYPQTLLMQLSVRERPAARLKDNPAACNLAELLAVIIGGQEQIEVASQLLARFKTIQGITRAHACELEQVPGIGGQTALRLKASLELGRRLLQPEEERVAVHTPQEAAQILMPILAHREQEFLVVLLLDTRSRVMHVAEVYHGCLNASTVRIGEVFKAAVQQNAASILVAHNHPSQDPTPSAEDISVTRNIVQAGKLMDINVLDHLIIGLNRWVSLKEKGLGF